MDHKLAFSLSYGPRPDVARFYHDRQYTEPSGENIILLRSPICFEDTGHEDITPFDSSSSTRLTGNDPNLNIKTHGGAPVVVCCDCGTSTAVIIGRCVNCDHYQCSDCTVMT